MIDWFIIGLIFAIVAFQFIIAERIPNLPYLTIVDKYNLGVFVFLILNSFESVFVSVINNYGYASAAKELMIGDLD